MASNVNNRCAIFLDRDGVINENPSNYVKCWDELHFLPGVLAALKDLAELPWPVVMITNQSAVGRGIISRESLDEIHAKLLDRVGEAGGRLDGVYVCPHTPEDGCDCRKPLPGLFLRAAEEMSLDLRGSVMIGDSLSDARAALAVEVLPILVRSNQSHLEPVTPENRAIFERCVLATSLTEAVGRIRDGFREGADGPQPAHMVYFASGVESSNERSVSGEEDVV